VTKRNRTIQSRSQPRAVIENPSTDGGQVGWATVRLGELLIDIQPGFACGAHSRGGAGVPHLRPMNVSTTGQIVLDDLKLVPVDVAKDAEKWLEAGDVLFNNTNSPELVGKTAFYGMPDHRAFSNHMTRLRVKSDRLEPQYCAAILHQLWRTGEFETRCNNHVSQASISREVLRDIEIPLPPLPEQKRIVEAIERLTARVDAARDRLANVPAILKRFRQAVLAAACSGRLTEAWRETKAVADGSLSRRLLDAIDAERTKLWTAEVTLRGRNPSKVRKSSPVNPTEDFSIEVPEQWVVVSMERLTQTITSGSRDWKQYYTDAGSGTFVMAQNIRPMLFDRSYRLGVNPPQGDRDRVRSEIRKGDVLVTIVGANTGDVCRVPEDVTEHYVCQSVALMRPVFPVLAPWLEIWLNSPSHGKAQYESWIYGEGRPHISFDHLKSTAVALPTTEEQAEIVRRVESLMKLADAIERRVALAQDRADKLTQSMLAKAFRGDLSQPEPTDICFASQALNNRSNGTVTAAQDSHRRTSRDQQKGKARGDSAVKHR